MLVCRSGIPERAMAPGYILLLRLILGSDWTRRPVVTISSPIDDKDDDEGCDDISTHDSVQEKLVDANYYQHNLG